MESTRILLESVIKNLVPGGREGEGGGGGGVGARPGINEPSLPRGPPDPVHFHSHSELPDFSTLFNFSFPPLTHLYSTPAAEHNPTHLGFVSSQDFRMGRFMFCSGIIVLTFVTYLEPSWFHETIGHLKPSPSYDVIRL